MPQRWSGEVVTPARRETALVTLGRWGVALTDVYTKAICTRERTG